MPIDSDSHQSPWTAFAKAMHGQAFETWLAMLKAYHGGPFIGPKGGKWANPEHTEPWTDAHDKRKQELADTKIASERIKALSAEGKLHPGMGLPEHVKMARGKLAEHNRSLPDFKAKLHELSGGKAEIKGRTKKLTSVLGKLVRKHDEAVKAGKDVRYKHAGNLQDLTGARITHDTEDEVKETVKRLKEHYPVVEEDDYIAKTKGHGDPDEDIGYRSHHLIVRDSDGHQKEIQVRTRRQNEHANWSHDVYKPENERQAKAMSEHGSEIKQYSRDLSAALAERDRGHHDHPLPDMPESVRKHFHHMIKAFSVVAGSVDEGPNRVAMGKILGGVRGANLGLLPRVVVGDHEELGSRFLEVIKSHQVVPGLRNEPRLVSEHLLEHDAPSLRVHENTQNAASQAFSWVPMTYGFGDHLWSRGISKSQSSLTIGDAEYMAMPFALAKAVSGQPRPGARYIKRVPTGNPRRPWRYYYQVQHGGGVANHQHMVEGASFAHGAGHYRIHGVRDGKLIVTHSTDKRKRLMTHDELAGKLSEHHAPAIEAHKQKLFSTLADARKHGSPMQVANLEAEAKRHGIDTAQPKPAATSDKPSHDLAQGKKTEADFTKEGHGPAPKPKAMPEKTGDVIGYAPVHQYGGGKYDIVPVTKDSPKHLKRDMHPTHEAAMSAAKATVARNRSAQDTSTPAKGAWPRESAWPSESQSPVRAPSQVAARMSSPAPTKSNTSPQPHMTSENFLKHRETARAAEQPQTPEALVARAKRLYGLTDEQAAKVSGSVSGAKDMISSGDREGAIGMVRDAVIEAIAPSHARDPDSGQIRNSDRGALLNSLKDKEYAAAHRDASELHAIKAKESKASGDTESAEKHQEAADLHNEAVHKLGIPSASGSDAAEASFYAREASKAANKDVTEAGAGAPQYGAKYGRRWMRKGGVGMAFLRKLNGG